MAMKIVEIRIILRATPPNPLLPNRELLHGSVVPPEVLQA
jgi:hypothetical protein